MKLRDLLYATEFFQKTLPIWTTKMCGTFLSINLVGSWAWQVKWDIG